MQGLGASGVNPTPTMENQLIIKWRLGYMGYVNVKSYYVAKGK